MSLESIPTYSSYPADYALSDKIWQAYLQQNSTTKNSEQQKDVYVGSAQPQMLKAMRMPTSAEVKKIGEKISDIIERQAGKTHKLDPASSRERKERLQEILNDIANNSSAQNLQQPIFALNYTA